ncbi:hypothetical protein D3C74_438600 [compost metagenome]
MLIHRLKNKMLGQQLDRLAVHLGHFRKILHPLAVQGFPYPGCAGFLMAVLYQPGRQLF